MLPSYFAIIGAFIISFGGFYYLYETLTGKVQPNRVTWLLWGVLPAIVFIAQRVQGVESLSWATFAAGLMPFLVFGASFFNKKVYWKTEPLDYVMLCVAAIGIILWGITKEPNIAILFTIIADFSASIPTIIKSFKHPETESWRAYAIGAGGLLVCILSIHSFDFQTSAFVLYLFVNESLLATLSLREKTIA